MSLPLFHLLTFLFFLLSSINQTHCAFSFIKNLEGSHKGSKAKDVLKLKEYLEEFGYLQYTYKAHHAKDDYFDDTLVSAVKTYQRYFHLKPTGVLDAKTVSTMMRPRCGNPDIENGTSFMMNSHEDSHNYGSLHTLKHYSFPPNKPKWPASKYRLTYAYVTPVPATYVAAIDRAYKSWAKVSKFTFVKVSSSSVSDCTIGFFTGDHGDKSPFKGPGGPLAHGFHPTSGKLHFDASQAWTVGAVDYKYDVESVAKHEIGHTLGLSHSTIEAALMYASINSGKTKDLHADDIQGITELYK